MDITFLCGFRAFCKVFDPGAVSSDIMVTQAFHGKLARLGAYFGRDYGAGHREGFLLKSFLYEFFP